MNAIKRTSRCNAAAGIVAALFACMLCLPFQAFAQASPPESNSINSSDIQKWLSLQEELRGHVDRRFIDLSAALDATDYDLDNIVRFVAHQIAFEAYSGSVRGASGTLQSRAGNSLDQSILLATLLKDAGYEARIAHATLPADLSPLLLRQMARKLKPVQVFEEGAETILLEIGEFLRGRMPGSNSDQFPWESQLEERKRLVTRISDSLRTELEKNDLPLDREKVPTGISEETGQYFWCQYRYGPGSDWKNAHPVFSETPEAFANLKPIEYFADKIPQNLVQKLSIDLFARVRKGSSSTSTRIMKTWIRPTANIHETPIRISLIPSQFSRMLDEEYDASSDLFLPYIFQSMAPGASAVDLNGNILPADAALSNMAGIFKAASDKGLSAASALQSLGKSVDDAEDSIMALEDIWLEIALSGPGVAPESRWRRSFRSDGGRNPPTADSLARKIVLNLSFGLPAESRLYDQSLRLQIEALKSTLNQQEAIDSNSFENLIGRKAEGYQVDRSVLEGIPDFTAMLKIIAPLSSDSVSYRPTPLVFAYHSNLFPESQEPEGIDIINNARRSFEFDGTGHPRFAPALNLQLGIAEAVAEHSVVDDRFDSSIDAVREFQAVLAGSSPIFFKDSASIDDQLDDESVSGKMIAAKVNEGYVVVTPPPDGNRGIRAWWEVDPKTGRTIGRTRNGWGGSYLIMSSTNEDLITRAIVIGGTCLMITTISCAMYSKLAVKAVAVGISGGGYAACKLFFLVGPGSNLPPAPAGAPDPCDSLKLGPVYLIRALRGMEERLYKWCFDRVLKECIKAAATRT